MIEHNAMSAHCSMLIEDWFITHLPNDGIRGVTLANEGGMFGIWRITTNNGYVVFFNQNGIKFYYLGGQLIRDNRYERKGIAP